MKVPYMVVPKLDQAGAIPNGGGGPPAPSVYTYVTNRTASNNVFWFDASAYPRLIDIGTPGPTNVVCSLKYIFHVESILVGIRALCGNRGGNGGFSIQGGYTLGSSYQARMFTEDDSGSNRFTALSPVSVSVGDIVVLHAIWDALGQRCYLQGTDEQAAAFTSGYGQFNGNGGFVLGADSNRSGYFDGSTLAVQLSQGVDIIACSIRKGVALSAAQVAADFAVTDPANLHLANATHAWRPDPTDATKMITDIGTADLTYNTTDALDPPVIGTVAP